MFACGVFCFNFETRSLVTERLCPTKTFQNLFLVAAFLGEQILEPQEDDSANLSALFGEEPSFNLASVLFQDNHSDFSEVQGKSSGSEAESNRVAESSISCVEKLNSTSASVTCPPSPVCRPLSTETLCPASTDFLQPSPAADNAMCAGSAESSCPRPGSVDRTVLRPPSADGNALSLYPESPNVVKEKDASASASSAQIVPSVAGYSSGKASPVPGNMKADDPEDDDDDDSDGENRLYIASDVESEKAQEAEEVMGVPEVPVRLEQTSVASKAKSARYCCNPCRNHGLSVPLKGHKAKCPYRECSCHLCKKSGSAKKRRRRSRSGSTEASLQTESAVHEQTVCAVDSDEQREKALFCENLVNEWMGGVGNSIALPSRVGEGLPVSMDFWNEIMPSDLLSSALWQPNIDEIPAEKEDRPAVAAAPMDSGLPLEVKTEEEEVIPLGPTTPSLVPDVRMELPWDAAAAAAAPQFICEDCGLSLSSRRLLAEHRLVNHSGAISSTCSLCSSVSWSPLQHDIHLAVSHDPPYYRCQLCLLCFPSEALLHAHAFAAHLAPCSCPQCGCPCYSLEQLAAHTHLVHGAEKLFACEQCGSRHHTPAELVAHHHRDHAFGPGLGASADLRCLACCYAFPTRDMLQHHVNVAHAGPKPYGCPSCRRIFKSPHGLAVHVKMMHVGASVFACPDCPCRYPSARDLLLHACHCRHMLATTRGPNACRVCASVFQDRLALADHEECVHMGLVPLGRLAHLLSLVNELPAMEQAEPGAPAFLPLAAQPN